MAGKRLDKITSVRTTWKAWRKKNPHTLVLSTETGYRRDYLQDPYEGYYRSLGIWFPVGDVRKDLSPEEMVLGVDILGTARAYPLSLLRKRPGILRDEISEKPIQIRVTPDGEVLEVRDHQGKEIPSIFAYWFAWQAFHPKTTVYKEKK